MQPSQESLRELEFLGRLTGLALFHGKILDVTFAEPLYKVMRFTIDHVFEIVLSSILLLHSFSSSLTRSHFCGSRTS